MLNKQNTMFEIIEKKNLAPDIYSIKIKARIILTTSKLTIHSDEQ